MLRQLFGDITGVGNRGSFRHRVDDNQNIFDDFYYNIFKFIFEPGRWCTDILEQFVGLKFERVGGDVVLAGAPASVAIEWHQD